jgi:hypothetical protein
MLSAVFIEWLPAIVSIVMGIMSTHWKQTQEDLHRERLHALKATEDARRHNAQSDGGNVTFIVQSAIGSLFLFPMALTVLNWIAPFIHLVMFNDRPWIEFQPIAIYIPEQIKNGGLFSLLYNKEEIKYVPITGFVLLPIHYYMAQLIGGYFFGARMMRRQT